MLLGNILGGKFVSVLSDLIMIVEVFLLKNNLYSSKNFGVCFYFYNSRLKVVFRRFELMFEI